MERNIKSICYMSLGEAFITGLRKETEYKMRSRLEKGINVEILPVTIDRHDFIYDYLTNLYNAKKGTFNKPKIFNKGSKTTIYECERSNPCKGNSSGDPMKTRANGCNAYVSFIFEEGATITACIVRSRLCHTGHDPNNRDEAKISRIDVSLKYMIEMNVRSGMEVAKIMSEIAKWNKVRKNTDHRNRRYFPTRQAVHQLAMSIKKNPPVKILPGIHAKVHEGRMRKYDTSRHSKDNVSRFLRTELRNSCIYHQSRTISGATPRPLIVVIQNADMRQTLNKYGHHFIFVHKNYQGLVKYSNAVYILSACDDNGKGGPVTYIITSDDSASTFIQALHKLISTCHLEPKAFFLERDLHSFSEVMSSVFPKSLFLISFCQVLQDIHEWLQNSQVRGKEHSEIRRVLLQYIVDLKAHDKEEWFVSSTNEIRNRIEYDEFLSMLHNNWFKCASKWSDFGRIEICEDSHNSAFNIERYFVEMYNGYLKGLHTKTCLEDLLKLITHNINEFNKYEGPLKTTHAENTDESEASTLMKQGWGQLISWQEQWVATVPCNSFPDISYRVNLITMECECPKLITEGPCVHLSLASILAESRPAAETGFAVEQERNRLASDAYINSDYVISDGFCVIFHSGGLCVCKGDGCTCVAHVFGVQCVGQILMKMAEGAESEGVLRESEGVLREGVLRESEGVLRDSKGVLRGREGLFRESEAVFMESEEGVLNESEGVLREGVFMESEADFRKSEAIYSENEADFMESEAIYSENEGIFCMPLKNNKNRSPITITLNSDEQIIKEENPLFLPPSKNTTSNLKPIVIKTWTGIDFSHTGKLFNSSFSKELLPVSKIATVTEKKTNVARKDPEINMKVGTENPEIIITGIKTEISSKLATVTAKKTNVARKDPEINMKVATENPEIFITGIKTEIPTKLTTAISSKSATVTEKKTNVARKDPEIFITGIQSKITEISSKSATGTEKKTNVARKDPEIIVTGIQSKLTTEISPKSFTVTVKKTNVARKDPEINMKMATEKPEIFIPGIKTGSSILATEIPSKSTTELSSKLTTEIPPKVTTEIPSKLPTEIPSKSTTEILSKSTTEISSKSTTVMASKSALITEKNIKMATENPKILRVSPSLKTKSQKIIEELFEWSKSDNFTDSNYLEELLTKTYTVAIGNRGGGGSVV